MQRVKTSVHYSTTPVCILGSKMATVWQQKGSALVCKLINNFIKKKGNKTFVCLNHLMIGKS